MAKYEILSNGIYYAELDGTKGGYEIGRQNGEIFADLIHDNVKVMKDIYSSEIGMETLDRILEEMIDSEYVDDLKKHMPELYDEMRGIADGSKITLKDAFMLNYLEEVPNKVISECNVQESLNSGKCTAAAIVNRKDKSNMLFQNMDFTDAYEGFQVVYKIKNKDIDILMYGFVGQFGGIGINSKGVGVTINVISNVAANVGKGIPSTALTRKILESNSLKECIDVMESFPISTGGSYTVTDPVGAICFEASANNIEKIYPTDEKYIVHSNHAVQSSDLIDVPGQFKGLEAILNEDGESLFLTVERQKLGEDLVKEVYETLDEKDAERILATKPILLHCDLGAGLESNTIQSVINICDEKEPKLFVSKGRKEDREYVEIGF